jgi:hypothetical protein
MEGAKMRKAGVVAVAIAILTLALVSAGCDGTTAEATRWVTVAGDVQQHNSSGLYSKSTAPFELTGAPSRLRYETTFANSLEVYLVAQVEPTKRQSILYMRNRSPEEAAGETAISVEPGTYYLEIEGLPDNYAWHLRVEEQR